MSNNEQGASVPQAEVLAFADEAFRNRDITFSHRDVVDMTAALCSFLARHRRASHSGKSGDDAELEPTDDYLRGYYSGRRDGVSAVIAFSQPIVDGAEVRLVGLAVPDATQTRQTKTGDVLTSDPDRFRKFAERIAAWTDEELTVVDAKQCRHVAQVVIAGADPIYPPFGPSAIGWTIVPPSNGGAA